MIAFVILHYKTEIDTCECIESLRRLKSTCGISIIVADNGSNDGSIERIKEQYEDIKNI